MAFAQYFDNERTQAISIDPKINHLDRDIRYKSDFNPSDHYLSDNSVYHRPNDQTDCHVSRWNHHSEEDLTTYRRNHHNWEDPTTYSKYTTNSEVVSLH